MPDSVPERPRATRLLIWFGVFAVVAGLHMLSTVKTSWDSAWTVHVAYSLCTSGDTDLDEWSTAIDPTDYRVHQDGGKWLSVFPDGTPILAVPFVGARIGISKLMGEKVEPEMLEGWIISDMQEAIGSVFAAIAAVLVGLMGRQLGLRLWPAVALAMLFAFGTQAWSTASRALWSNGSTMLMLALALLLLVQARARASSGSRLRWFLCGAALGFAFVCRPTAIVPIVFCTVAAAFWSRRGAAYLVLGGAAVALCFLVHNQYNYEAWVPQYYHGIPEPRTSTFWEGILGNLFSPSRGLFVYVPVSILALVGLFRMRNSDRSLSVLVGAVLIGHIALISKAPPFWWAGHCYGPRLFTDVMPFLFVGLVPVFAFAFTRRGSGRNWSRMPLAILAAISIAMNFVGAMRPATTGWNVLPEDIHTHPERHWDWSDAQFMRWHEPEPLDADESSP